MSFSQLLSFGYFPAVVIVGLWLSRKLFPRNRGEAAMAAWFGACLPIGVLALFPLLLVLAWNGLFQPAAIGGAGWAVAVVGGFAVKRDIGGEGFDLRAKCREFDFLFPLILGVLALLFYGFFANESIFSGRDEGSYSNHAAGIAQSGSLFIRWPHPLMSDPEFFPLFRTTTPLGYMIDWQNNRLYGQFPPLTALQMAPAFGVAGYEGAIRVNAVVAAFSAILFFGLLRQFVSRNWAIFGVVFFAFNSAQVWNARITLSEPLAQAVLLAGMTIAVFSIKRSEYRNTAIGLLVASLAPLVRVDAFLMIALVPYIWASLHLFAPEEDRSAARRYGLWGTVLAFLLAGIASLYYHLCCPKYFGDFHGKLGLMGIVAVAGFLIQIGVGWEPLHRWAREFARSRVVWGSLIGLALVGLVYAYFFRPYIEPFSMFENPAYGDRNYRELSLRHLAVYISWPAVLLGVAGFLLCVRRATMRAETAVLVTLGPWLAYTLLYLYDPNISPDHIWRVRRYTPMVIPGFAFFSILGLFYMARRAKFRCFESIVWWGSFAALIAFLTVSLGPIAFFKERRGAIALVASLEQSLPDDAVIVSDLGRELMGPLHLGLGLSLANADFTDKASRDLIERFIERQGSASLFALAPYPIGDPSGRIRESPLAADIPVLDHTYHPPAREVYRQSYRIHIAQVDEALFQDSSDARMVSLGGYPRLEIQEEGMHGQEYADGRPCRWTSDRAVFTIEESFERPLTSVIFESLGSEPGGSAVKIAVNGRQIAAFDAPPYHFEKRFDLEPIFIEEALALAIDVEHWIPSELISGSSDDRELGIMLSEIVLLFDSEPVWGAMEFGIRTKRGVRSEGLHAIETIDQRRVRWTNGRASWQFRMQDGFTPRELAIGIEGSLRESETVSVLWNDRLLAEEEIGKSPEILVVPLDGVNSERDVVVELRSGSASPKSLGINEDLRELGVMLNRVEIR